MIFLTTGHLKAQVGTPSSGFITGTGTHLQELTTSQLSNYNKVIGKETVVSTKFVQMGDLPTAQHDGILELKHPDKDCTAKVKAKHVESYPSGDFYWYGEVESELDENGKEKCDCSVGYVDIMKRNGKTFGLINIDDESYDLEDLGEGKNLLAKKDFTGHDAKCGTAEGENYNGGNGDGGVGERSGGSCPVRVLAMYTVNANDAVGNIEGKIELAIKRTNASFRRSLVQECDLELILVDMVEFDFPDEDDFNGVPERDARIDINTMLNTSNSAGQAIEGARNRTEADIVVVFTNSKYMNGVIGRAGTLMLQPERALCLIRAKDMNRSFNTSHEIAHLFSCRHEPEADPNGPFEHAHNIWSLCRGAKINTIMHSSYNHFILGVYSNPDVKYQGLKTGVTNEKENWRQLRDNACIVANFMSPPTVEPLYVSWDAPFHICTCEYANITATVTGGVPGPYTIEWYTSNDGFDWGSPISTTNSANVLVPSGCPTPVLDHIFVKVEVESADGQMITRFRRIEAVDQVPGSPFPCRDPDERSAVVIDRTEKLIEIFPNPVVGDMKISISGYMHETVPVEIYDTFGKRVFYKKFPVEQEIETLLVSTNAFSNGIYTVKIGDQGIEKIIKIGNH